MARDRVARAVSGARASGLAVGAILLLHLISSLPAQAQSCVAPPAGMTAWWRGEFDGSDQLGSHNGVFPNGATVSSGKVGNAFGFDGVNQYLQVPDSSAWDFGTAS